MGNTKVKNKYVIYPLHKKRTNKTKKEKESLQILYSTNLFETQKFKLKSINNGLNHKQS